ncbi:MAG: protein-methionine-sulfoxide reductase catalytic subunit MsrP [Rhodospirillaceae bacterium]
MLIRRPASWEVKPSEITPQSVYRSRRRFMAASAAGAIGALALGSGLFRSRPAQAATNPLAGAIAKAPTGPFATDEALTSIDDATSYNNFYEFGTGKGDPKRNSGGFNPLPWTIKIDGEVAKPQTVSFDDLISPSLLEERIYRMRCVEAWSMVIPWVGFPLSALLNRVEPLSSAKYVSFETVFRPEEMPGQKGRSLDWPYREGLRLDEAMHPLTIMAVGMYGEVLPNQNGAPVRLVVPWKYGFKSIKSVVNIKLTKDQPATSWNLAQPREYGFYSNVNPTVDHPRWSQARERRIGEFFRRDTLMFNGYEEAVASLYADMDLTKDF